MVCMELGGARLDQAAFAEIAFESAKDEYTDFAVYKRLSEFKFKTREFSRTLRRLAGMEYRHYILWKKYCPGRKPTINKLTVYMIVLLRFILGVTFAVRYLERNEKNTIKKYRDLAYMIPSKDKKQYNEMIADEEEHEMKLSDFNEPQIKYISFIVLGLADALVEIAGIHAGSLGIYNSTELAGLAGIIAGAAASVAMASAAYAQAKTGFKGSAALSAVYTGVSYFVTAVILATPYFLTKVMFDALGASLFFAVLLIAFISFYGAVISGAAFKKDFIEITCIMFGATIALYLLGTAIKYLTKITI
jgi:VIT1/CCC1 family predicted Fe2+/Mn2+ transporter